MLALNLVPPKIKSEQRSSASLHQWLSIMVILTVFSLLGTAAGVVIWQLMERHAKTVHTELTQLQQKQSAANGTDITTTTSALNTTIKTVSTALGTPQSWATLSQTVFATLPSGVTLTKFSLAPNGAFTISGTADSRQTFVNLDQSLKKDSRLRNVATTSTASKRTDVPFDFTGIVNPTQP